VISLAKEMHVLFAKGQTPKVERNQNCKNCSLIDICIPDLTRKPLNVKKYIRFHINGMHED
jgi:CRISPR-associated exonuclease Cas4